jgi:UDP-3-O-[3-hydroxymyristoyl] N-acetylglucosamine deacetylase
VGLHSGRKINMMIKPAGVDHGIVFCRKDLGEKSFIQAKPTNVCDTTLATTLGEGDIKVSTVEHLLSAFFGIGVDNVLVKVNSFEIPIMDGSALQFVEALKNAGIKNQNKPKRLMVIKKPVSVQDEDGKAMIVPSPRFEITYRIDFNHPAIRMQSYHMVFSHEKFEKDISPARTFGFLNEVEYLQARGLALGGSLKNAIVLDNEKVINKEGLRFPDEFVRHKVLDSIGDLSLLGIPIIGHFFAYKSGHKLNNLLLRKLLMHEECWEIVDSLDKKEEVFNSIVESYSHDFLSETAAGCQS